MIRPCLAKQSRLSSSHFPFSSTERPAVRSSHVPSSSPPRPLFALAVSPPGMEGSPPTPAPKPSTPLAPSHQIVLRLMNILQQSLPCPSIETGPLLLFALFAPFVSFLVFCDYLILFAYLHLSAYLPSRTQVSGTWGNQSIFS